MAKVVGADLHLEPVLRPRERAGHHAGIIDQDVDLLQGVAQLLRALPHTFQAGKVAPESQTWSSA